jgi:[protein-PII] uridylyltransferase
VDDTVRGLAEELPDSVAMVALGGYGRRLLLPGSDVDLMVLHEGVQRIGETAERLFYPLWDAGISLGHAVRTVDESLDEARTRLDVACSLLDARWVAGDRGAVEELRAGVLAELRNAPERFLSRLREDAEARHRRFPAVSMALEPDLKEGAGGLRDLQSVRWAVRVAGSALLVRQAAVLDEAEEFMVRVRSALHLEAGRRTDRLVAPYQPAIAAAFGYQATAGLEATDALMRALFEHGRDVEHVHATMVLPRDGQLDVDPPTSREEVMEAFAAAAGPGSAPQPGLVEAVAGLDLGSAPDPWTERGRRAFLDILAAGEAGAQTLEAMDRSGVLVGFLPEWEPVRCRPQRNPYHRFTVDVHLVRTAEHVGRVLAGEGNDPILRVAAGAIDDPDALLLGALFHDIGKIGGSGHAEAGERIAEGAFERMGIGGRTREDALFLIRHHLLLADTAVRRDLEDQNLILDVAATIGHPRRLAMLYVLTVADAEATGPHAATPWRLALVRDLVGKVQHVLESGDMGPDRAEVLANRLRAIAGHLDREEPGSVRAYLARLPRPYVLAVEPEVAATEFRLIAPPIGAAEVRTAAGPGDRPGSHDVTVVAADRPGLLARIAGSLSLAGLNILSAQAFTTEDGVAIDRFAVEPAFHGEVDEDRWRGFRRTLRRALEGREWLEERVREKRRHYPPPDDTVVTEITILDRASDFFTVIEVAAADRIGLLHDLAGAFEDLRLDVHLAKVATYGPRVVDVFYVRDLEGRKLADAGVRSDEVERSLRARLGDG